MEAGGDLFSCRTAARGAGCKPNFAVPFLLLAPFRVDLLVAGQGFRRKGMLRRAERYVGVQTVVFHVQNLDEVFRLRCDHVSRRRCLIGARINCRRWPNREEIPPVIAEFNVIELEAGLRLNGEFDGRNLTRLFDVLNIEDAFVDALALKDS